MLLVIVALLLGVVGAMVVFKITRWWEGILLTSLGVLATVAVYNGDVARLLGWLTQWAG